MAGACFRNGPRARIFAGRREDALEEATKAIAMGVRKEELWQDPDLRGLFYITFDESLRLVQGHEKWTSPGPPTLQRPSGPGLTGLSETVRQHVLTGERLGKLLCQWAIASPGPGPGDPPAGTSPSPRPHSQAVSPDASAHGPTLWLGPGWSAACAQEGPGVAANGTSMAGGHACLLHPGPPGPGPPLQPTASPSPLPSGPPALNGLQGHAGAKDLHIVHCPQKGEVIEVSDDDD